jgi:hypothetical protein
MAAQGTRTASVALNWLGLQRVNAALQVRGIAPVAVAPVPVGQEVSSVVTRTGERAQTLPPVVDNSQLPYFPPIRSQGELGSCASFSTTYYTMTHMTALARGWNVTSPSDNTNKFSPRWSYAFVNDGVDQGSTLVDNYQILLKHGAATWAEFAYEDSADDPLSYRAWNLDTEVWRRAINFRMDKAGMVTDVNTTDGLRLLKELLVNGYILNYGTDINQWHFTNISDDPATRDDDMFAGRQVCDFVAVGDSPHAMTVVGYNDHIWIDLNQNHEVEPGEKGALLIANSWGTDWQDSGFTWLAYDALRTTSAVGGWTASSRQPAWHDNCAYWVTARSSYTPRMLAEFTISHTVRNQLRVVLGSSIAVITSPVAIWQPAAMNNTGGPYQFDGSLPMADGSSTPIEATFVLDFTDLQPAEDISVRWYLGAFDNELGAPGVVKSFTFYVTPHTTLTATGLPAYVDSGQHFADVVYPTESASTDANVRVRVYDGATASALGNALVEVWSVGTDTSDPPVAAAITTSSFSTTTPSSNAHFDLPAGMYRMRVSAAGRRTVESSFVLKPDDSVLSLVFRLEHLLALHGDHDGAVTLFSLPGDYQGLDFSTVLQVSAASLAEHGLATYDPSLVQDEAIQGYQRYIGVGTLPMRPGQAYWIRLLTSTTVSQEGANVSTTTEMSTGKEYFRRELAPGWNLVGNPFTQLVDLYACRVLPGGSSAPMPDTIGYSWAEAQRSGYVSGVIYTWNGDEYVPSTQLAVNSGYWVYATTPCALFIPRPITLTSLSPAPLLQHRRVPRANDWRVNLVVCAGDRRDTAATFGVGPTATDGFDPALDEPQPPKPFGRYVVSGFVRRGWRPGVDALTADIQGAMTTTKRWLFQVDTNQPDTDVAISWPALAAQLPAGCQAVLVDLTTQQRCYLNTTTQYTFRSGPEGAVRYFEILVSPRTAPLLVSEVRGVGQRGVRTAMPIAFTLSTEAKVDVVIRTHTGRVVRVLATDWQVSAGANSLVWDGRDSQGRQVPRGVYLCEVHAVDADGRQARGTGLLTFLSVQ